MIEFILRALWEIWDILKEASVFLLLGFVIAGVLAVLVPTKLLSKVFGTGKVRSVLWASAIGAPLPLCSCGVVPTAMQLNRQGATPGATVAFLVATPETGIDSISLSYALMDPIITIFRPIAGVITAIVAGLAANFLGAAKRPDPPAVSASIEQFESDPEHAHGHRHDHGVAPAPTKKRKTALRTIASRVYDSAFHRLMDDISYWLMLGFVLSGIVAAALPATFLDQYMGGGLTSMVVMLLIGIPVYTCASSSTPLAAALVLKGLNPGAALVFLLSGPATNLSSLVVLARFLGARILTIYLATIVIITLAAGYALNWMYRVLGIDPRATFGAATGFLPEPLKVAAALVLIALLVGSMRRAGVPGEWIWLRDRVARVTGVRVTARWVALCTCVVMVVLYVASGLFAVQPGEVGVRLRFGAIVAPLLGPGLHYRLPWPFEAHRIVQKERVQRIEFGVPANATNAVPMRAADRTRTTAGGFTMPDAINTTGTLFQKESANDEPFLLTGDGNLINLRWSVQFRIKDPIQFAFNLAEPDAFVRGASLAALRGVVARSGIDAIYTADRTGVSREVERSIQATLDHAQSGIEVLSFQLLYVHPPDQVHDAFRDVASAQEDKLRTINRANIFAVETVNQAKGEAAAMVEQALAFRDEQVLHAQGDAAGFLLRLGAYRQAPELTQFRLQVETIEGTLPGLQKFVRPGAGDIKDFDMWLLQPVGPSRSK